MAINKVVYGGNTLIDLTDLDVTAGDVAQGVTFILADGTKAVGTLTPSTIGIEAYVVAEGSTDSGKWTYRKWSNGRYEAWYNSGQTTVTTGTSSGNGWYRNTNEYTITPPSIGITAVTHVEVTVQTEYANLITSVVHANSSKLGYYVSHLGSISNASAYVSAYIYGIYS